MHEALDGLAEGGHALEDATLDGSAVQLRSAASSNPISAGERARPWPTGTWLTTTALNRYALFLGGTWASWWSLRSHTAPPGRRAGTPRDPVGYKDHMSEAFDARLSTRIPRRVRNDLDAIACQLQLDASGLREFS